MRRRPRRGCSATTAIEETREYHHRKTYPLDPETGQGDAHVQYGFSAHRAVVDVDLDLGLVKVVQLDCAQDVGKAINPDAVVGQIHGGSAQGLGLAVMEEIQVHGRQGAQPVVHRLPDPDHPRHAADDASTSSSAPDPHAPYGVRGVGEPPTISATPAIANAIRAATGLELPRVPDQAGAHHRNLRMTTCREHRLETGMAGRDRPPRHARTSPNGGGPFGALIAHGRRDRRDRRSTASPRTSTRPRTPR